MIELERMVATLVRNIESRFPHYLAAPFRIHEIHDQLIPYRLHRRELGVDTNEYYELALTRLLSGEGGYLLVPEEVRSALNAELASNNPDSARFRSFGNVDVKLTELAMVARGGTPAEPVPAQPPSATVTTTHSAPTPPVAQPAVTAPDAPKAKVAEPATVSATRKASRSPAKQAAAAAQRPAKVAAPANRKETVMPASQRTTNAASLGGKCRYCHGALPEGRDLTYCPHCGQDLTVHHCPACSTELEIGWKFCVTCGRSVSE